MQLFAVKNAVVYRIQRIKHCRAVGAAARKTRSDRDSFFDMYLHMRLYPRRPAKKLGSPVGDVAAVCGKPVAFKRYSASYSVARLYRDLIRQRYCLHHTFNIVVAVSAAQPHLEKQVYFCVRIDLDLSAFHP